MVSFREVRVEKKVEKADPASISYKEEKVWWERTKEEERKRVEFKKNKRKQGKQK